MPPRTLTPVWLALCAGCAAQATERDLFPDPRRGRDVVAQGWLGIGELESDDFERDARLPVTGGAFQQPLAGGSALAGFEAGVSFEWDGDLRSIHSGGGGVVVTIENDVLLADLFAGPYAEILLARRWRLYGATGGLLQYARCEAQIDDPATGPSQARADAFGGGIYARAGLEYVLPSGASIGLGLRWIDTEVDLGGQLGQYDLERVQWLFTLTRSS